MKILIENAVPLNNGDAALVFSIGKQFESRGDTVYYSTFNYQRVKKKYPEKNFIKSPLTKRIVTKIPGINTLYLIIILLTNPLYKEIDAIVSAPGGYINSYYGIRKKIKLLNLFNNLLKKPIYMYSQSIGYLTSRDEVLLAKSLKNFNLFYVRDKKSMERIKKITTLDTIYQTKDAAFLLPGDPNYKHKEGNKIAISVREWNESPREIETYKYNIKLIVKDLLRLGYMITFLSTCQGEEGYPDDSRIAKTIIRELVEEKENTECITLDDTSYTLEQFQKELTNYDFVIGTRLHACILSWINGVPAFNISYEEKGRECYNYLGIQEYCVGYGEKDSKLSSKIKKFLMEDDFKMVFSKVDEIHEESNEFFDKMYRNIKLIKR